jgi:hypothetical protein
MKQVRTYDTEAEAEYEAGLLEAQGIACEVRDRNHVRGSGFLPALWVLRDEDVQAALEALNYRPNARGWPWICSKCKSENEPQFDACWSCGAERS